ncbi:effector-associated constant component EACC1 [Streptomyces sp. NPDC001858]
MTEPDHMISVSLDAAGSEHDLRSLLGRLRAEAAAGGRARLDGVRPPPPPGSTGAAFDVLQFAVSGGLSAASLVVSVLQWQASRPRPPAVTLRRGDVTIVLTADAARDEETVRGLIELLDGGAAPAPRPEEPGSGDGTP